LTTLNSATLAPIASASVPTITAANVGCLAKNRNA
jgi:hypothetical protein